MTRRAALNASFTPELVTFVAAQVQSGRYGSASEVVWTGLRQVEEGRPAPELRRAGIPRWTARDGR